MLYPEIQKRKILYWCNWLELCKHELLVTFSNNNVFVNATVGRNSHYLNDARHVKTDLKAFVVVMTMTPTFQEYNLWCQHSPILKSQCDTKRRMGTATRTHSSFGMTTKTLRSVFSWRSSFVNITVGRNSHYLNGT